MPNPQQQAQASSKPKNSKTPASAQKASAGRRNQAATLTAAAREPISLAAVPEPTGYAIYQFTKIDPKLNCFRCYQLAYQPSLWSAHCVQRRWGRIGKKQRIMEQEFESQEEALRHLKRSLVRRLRRGYKLAPLDLGSQPSKTRL